MITNRLARMMTLFATVGVLACTSAAFAQKSGDTTPTTPGGKTKAPPAAPSKAEPAKDAKTADAQSADTPAAQKPTDSKTPAPKPPASPADNADADKPSSPAKDSAAGAKDEAEQEINGKMNAIAAQKKLLLEEAKFRKQQARINRLRALATEQGNEQRLAALDKLEAKMTELHERKIASARAALSDDEFNRVSKELQKGKGKGKGKANGNGKGAGKNGNGNGNGKAGGRGKGNAKPDQARETDDASTPAPSNDKAIDKPGGNAKGKGNGKEKGKP